MVVTASLSWTVADANTTPSPDEQLAQADPARAPTRAPERATGAEIYARDCSVCHGDDGAGAAWGRRSLRPAPRDFTAPAARRELTRERMIASVAAGRPGTAMTAWSERLDRRAIEAVVDHIRETLMRPDAADRGTADGPMPGGLSGDVAAGRRFYDGNCAECHGIDGDGKGPRAYFIVPPPRSFVDPSTRASFDRARLFRAIEHGVVGREMPAWGKVLDAQRIADVAEYVFRAFVRGEDGPGERTREGRER